MNYYMIRRRAAWASSAQLTGRKRAVTAARAEAAWLAGDGNSVAVESEASLTARLPRTAAWLVGELAYWRYRAGLGQELLRSASGTPYALSIGGDSTGASAPDRHPQR